MNEFETRAAEYIERLQAKIAAEKAGRSRWVGPWVSVANGVYSVGAK